MTAHDKHAPWPQEILHMKTNQEEQSAAELLRDQTIRCACESITASSTENNKHGKGCSCHWLLWETFRS